MQNEPRRWAMYACDYGDYYCHVGTKDWVKLFFSDQSIVPVEIIEDPEGRYWGWIESGKERPSMIMPSEIHFRVCFPYGPEALVEMGRGEIIRMSITRGGGEDGR